MEDQCSPPSWVYYPQEEDMEELKHTLLCTTLELEATVVSAQEEIRKREDEVTRLNDLLSRTIKERDEAEARYQKLMLEKLLIHQNQQEAAAAPLSAGTSSSDDEQQRWGVDSNNGFSPSNSDEYISLPPMEAIPQPQANLKLLMAKKPLPEKGKLLQAVLEAGPLLQTLLLAGPLPQWQHPPPQLDSIEIPPVAIPSPPTPPLLHPDSCTLSVNACFSNKRGKAPFEDSESSPTKKYHKVVHH